MRIAVAVATAWLIPFAVARAQPSCGDPPRVDDHTLKSELEGKAKILSSLIGDANLKGQIETARTDTFSKYPNAGAAHSDAYLEYMVCSFVLNDSKLSAQDKFRAIQEFRQAATQPVAPASQASTRGDRSPAVISKGDTNIGYDAAATPADPPRPAATDQAPPAGSVRTEGNQSPAINSAGNVGIQYGTPGSAARPQPGAR